MLRKPFYTKSPGADDIAGIVKASALRKWNLRSEASDSDKSLKEHMSVRYVALVYGIVFPCAAALGLPLWIISYHLY